MLGDDIAELLHPNLLILESELMMGAAAPLSSFGQRAFHRGLETRATPTQRSVDWEDDVVAVEGGHKKTAFDRLGQMRTLLDDGVHLGSGYDTATGLFGTSCQDPVHFRVLVTTEACN